MIRYFSPAHLSQGYPGGFGANKKNFSATSDPAERPSLRCFPATKPGSRLV